VVVWPFQSAAGALGSLCDQCTKMSSGVGNNGLMGAVCSREADRQG
jgi:hypothetical protein